MCFKKRKQKFQLLQPTTILVHHISAEQAEQYNNNIIHSNVVSNINLFKKEDPLMVEKLKAYRDELETEKSNLINKIIDVEAEVAAYRNELISKAEAERDARVAKLASDIDCINALIAREETAGVAADEPVTVVSE